MNPFKIEYAHRHAMLTCIDSVYATSYRIAPVLHEIGKLRDLSVDGVFRVATDSLFSWQDDHLKKPLQFLTISLPRHDGSIVHLRALRDMSAMLSIERTDGTSGVSPYPFRLSEHLRMRRVNDEDVEHFPGAALWVKNATALFMGLHPHSKKYKTDALEQLDFSQGADTRTVNFRYQPFVDALIEDLLLAASHVEKFNAPLNDRLPSQAPLEGGRINGWPKCLPVRVISPQRRDVFERRAELALKWYMANHDADYATLYVSAYYPTLEGRNNILAITSSGSGGKLASFLANLNITEQDLIGYEDWEIQGFLFQAKPFNVDKPSFRRELALHLRTESKPSAHEQMEIQMMFQDASRRREIRIQKMEADRARLLAKRQSNQLTS